jgi:hypothetical protein
MEAAESTEAPMKGAFQVDLYGNMYFLHSQVDRHALYKNPHAMITTQNQYGYIKKITHEGEKKTITATETRLRLCFNHPVQMMYIWGINRDRVRNIRLMLDGAPYYDGPVAPLIYKQQQRGITTDVIAIYFSNDPIGGCTYSSVNFSRIDNADLFIDTDEVGATIYAVGLNMQPLRYMQGMVGLVFSK